MPVYLNIYNYHLQLQNEKNEPIAFAASHQYIVMLVFVVVLEFKPFSRFSVSKRCCHFLNLLKV